MKKRESNFELLRIILMISIPVYHLMLYNGVFYLENNSNTVLGLILSAGGAIPADYAYMALSIFFLLKSKDRPVISKFLSFLALVAILFLVKFVTLRGLFGFNNEKYFVDLFLMKGAWWFVYPYMIILLIYPLLNRFIDKLKKGTLYVITAILIIIELINGYINNMNFINDLIAFLMMYFIMACLQNSDYKRFLGIKTNPAYMAILAFVCYVIMLTICIMSKYYMHLSLEESNQVVKHIIGRYDILAVVMGVAIFLMFKNLKVGYKKSINYIARSTVFVFLLHDTWLGVFWYFNKCCNDYAYYNTFEFVVWLLLYVVSVFVMAILFNELYRRFLENIINRFIDKVCRWKIIIKLDNLIIGKRT